MSFWNTVVGKTFTNPLEALANVSTFGQYGLIKGAASEVGKAFGPGGSLSPGAPPSQDLTGAAQNQADSSRTAVDAQTMANRPDQTNAFGSSTKWNQGPDGRWTMSQGFGGPLAGAAQGLQGQVASAFGSPMMTGDQARDQAINASYGQATSRLDPQWQQRESQMRSQLMNQGLDPTSEAFQTEMGNLGRSRNDAYGSAMNSAIGQGNEAGQAVFNQNMMARQMPLQNLVAMGGLLEQPGFSQAGSADPTQALAAALGTNSYNLQNKQMQNEFWTDLIGGLAGAGGKALGAK